MSKFEVVSGVEGCCLALDDTRIAGPKPWGGGTVIHAWETDKTYMAVDVDNAVSIPREHIVRCRDCTRFVPQGTHRFNGGVVNNDTCDVIRGFVVQINPDGFCAWGERKID